MASSSSTIIIKRNLALLGPPGSGKGSYGRLLSKFLGIPLVTVSDVLKQHDIVKPCGTLVEDDIVSTLLQHSLPTTTHYLLDGFPRTHSQIQLMETTWPLHLQVDAVIPLDVPKQVCRTKLLGRRYCEKCGGNYNIHAVDTLGFHLPAQLPQDCEQCNDNVGKYFMTRPDDVEHVVDARLEAHYPQMPPILDHYQKRKRLMEFVPYQGYDDVPRFHAAVETWLHQINGYGR